jgi:hypothetical protein
VHGSAVKLVLSAIENLSGPITDVKQTTRNAFDYARLEGRVEALEKQIEKDTPLMQRWTAMAPCGPFRSHQSTLAAFACL